MARQIIRGDSYGIRRPFYTYSFVDGEGDPLDLTGMTIRTTYKTAKTDPNTDTTDSTAVVKHFIEFDGAGDVDDSDGLFLVGDASGGIIVERLTSAETLDLSLNATYFNDVELTDANAEVFTWIYSEGLTAIDGYTNRTTDV